MSTVDWLPSFACRFSPAASARHAALNCAGVTFRYAEIDGALSSAFSVASC